MSVGRPIKNRDNKYIISEFNDYNILKNSLTIAQLEVLDKIVRKIYSGKIYLYYHRDKNGDIDIMRNMYTYVYAGFKPYGCEMAVYLWVKQLIDVQRLISVIHKCVSVDGKKIIDNEYDLINYIADGIVLKGDLYAKYLDDDFELYIKDIVYNDKYRFVFCIMENGVIKRFKVHSNGTRAYFNFNDNKIKLSKLIYL